MVYCNILLAFLLIGLPMYPVSSLPLVPSPLPSQFVPVRNPLPSFVSPPFQPLSVQPPKSIISPFQPLPVQPPKSIISPFQPLPVQPPKSIISPSPSPISKFITISLADNKDVCLDIIGNGDTTVSVFQCDKSASQQWAYSNGELINNGLCLSIADDILAPGSFLSLVTCSGTSSQKWTISNGQIVVSGSDFCLDTLGGLTYNYISAVINPCDDSTTQKWSVSNS